jgi:hypothetical protein
MEMVNEYLRRAEELRARAARAGTAAIRIELESVAEHFERLAQARAEDKLKRGEFGPTGWEDDPPPQVA